MRLPGGSIDNFDYTRSTFFDCDIGLFNAHYIGASVTEFSLNPAVGSLYRIRDEDQYVNRRRAKDLPRIDWICSQPRSLDGDCFGVPMLD